MGEPSVQAPLRCPKRARLALMMIHFQVLAGLLRKLRSRGTPTALYAAMSCRARVRHRYYLNNYFTEMCGGSEAGSYLRLIDFSYHSTLGLRERKLRSRGTPTTLYAAMSCQA